MADHSSGNGAAPRSRPALRPFSGGTVAHGQLRAAVLPVPGRPTLRVPLATSARWATPAGREPAVAVTEPSQRIPEEGKSPANEVMEAVPQVLTPSALDVSTLSRWRSVEETIAASPEAVGEVEADALAVDADDPIECGFCEGPAAIAADVVESPPAEASGASLATNPSQQQGVSAEIDPADQAMEEVEGLFCAQVSSLAPPLAPPLVAPPLAPLLAPPLVAPLDGASEPAAMGEATEEATESGDAADWWASSPEPVVVEAAEASVGNLSDADLASHPSEVDAGGSQLAIDSRWLDTLPPATPHVAPPYPDPAAPDPRPKGASVAETLEGIADRVRRGEIVVAADASASPEAVLASVLASLLTTGS